MERPTKVHCFFEQSGTFKREFIKIGIPAEDYDIQNHFGETDHVIDLFAEIEAAYDGRASVFDGIGGGDLIMAFFPCIYFCAMSQVQISLTEWNKRNMTLKQKYDSSLERMHKREKFAALIVKLMGVSETRGLRMIVENPWSVQTFLKYGFIKPPSMIDADRTRRGDTFVKPTAYWFINCVPCRMATEQPSNEVRNVWDAKKGSKAGMCSEERSMISPDYARNFIADFILGVPLSPSAYQQGELPLGLEAET